MNEPILRDDAGRFVPGTAPGPGRPINSRPRLVTALRQAPIDVAGAELAAGFGEQLSFDVAWELSDMGLIDNFVSMHGRRTFQGTRSVFASFAA